MRIDQNDALRLALGPAGARFGTSCQHEVVHQLQQLAHEVFAYGFIDAMRPTLLVGVAVLGLAAISCLGIKRRARQPQPESARKVAAA